MAGSKGTRYYDVFLDYNVNLKSKGKVVISPELFILLKEIEVEESLLEAAKKCDISYRKAWGDVRKLENDMGFKFVLASRGGAKGGKTILTSEGSNILKAYHELIVEMDMATSNISKKFFNKINQ